MIVFLANVDRADDGKFHALCGQPGRSVTIEVFSDINPDDFKPGDVIEVHITRNPLPRTAPEPGKE